MALCQWGVGAGQDMPVGGGEASRAERRMIFTLSSGAFPAPIGGVKHIILCPARPSPKVTPRLQVPPNPNPRTLLSSTESDGSPTRMLCPGPTLGRRVMHPARSHPGKLEFPGNPASSSLTTKSGFLKFG